MEYALLGSSGTAVSRLALGTMTFGAETSEPDAFAQLDAFRDAGGTLVDTADVYSGGVSESIIGRWIAQTPSRRGEIVLATKGRFPTDTLPTGVGLSRRHLSDALDASLKRLQVDTIDLYQVHAWDPYTPIEETLRFVDDAVTAGKIHYFGLSNFTGWQITQTVERARAAGLTVPVTLQPQYNLLVRDIELEIIPSCDEYGLGLLPWSPLGGGWLTGKYTRDVKPTGSTRVGENPDRGMESYDRRNHAERTWNVVEAVRSVAEQRGESMAQVALAWLVDQPAVTSVILGARTQDQLDQNLAASGVHLTETELDLLSAASAPNPSDYPYGEPGEGQRSRKIAGGR